MWTPWWRRWCTLILGVSKIHLCKTGGRFKVSKRTPMQWVPHHAPDKQLVPLDPLSPSDMQSCLRHSTRRQWPQQQLKASSPYLAIDVTLCHPNKKFEVDDHEWIIELTSCNSQCFDNFSGFILESPTFIPIFLHSISQFPHLLHLLTLKDRHQMPTHHDQCRTPGFKECGTKIHAKFWVHWYDFDKAGSGFLDCTTCCVFQCVCNLGMRVKSWIGLVWGSGSGLWTFTEPDPADGSADGAQGRRLAMCSILWLYWVWPWSPNLCLVSQSFWRPGPEAGRLASTAYRNCVSLPAITCSIRIGIGS